MSFTNMFVAHVFAVQRSHIKEWDIAETKGKGPFPEILEYDIFVNCILLSEVLRSQNILILLVFAIWGRVWSENKIPQHNLITNG